MCVCVCVNCCLSLLIFLSLFFSRIGIFFSYISKFPSSSTHFSFSLSSLSIFLPRLYFRSCIIYEPLIMYRPTSKVSVAKQLGRDVTCQWLTDQEDAVCLFCSSLVWLNSGSRYLVLSCDFFFISFLCTCAQNIETDQFRAVISL